MLNQLKPRGVKNRATGQAGHPLNHLVADGTISFSNVPWGVPVVPPTPMLVRTSPACAIVPSLIEFRDVTSSMTGNPPANVSTSSPEASVISEVQPADVSASLPEAGPSSRADPTIPPQSGQGEPSTTPPGSPHPQQGESSGGSGSNSCRPGGSTSPPERSSTRPTSSSERDSSPEERPRREPAAKASSNRSRTVSATVAESTMSQINSNARFLWGKANYEIIINTIPGTNNPVQIPGRPMRSHLPQDTDSYEVSIVRYKRPITMRGPHRSNQGRICLTCEEFEIDFAIERLAETLRFEVTAAKCKFHAQIRVLCTDDWQGAISWRIKRSLSMDRLLRLVMCGDVIASGLWRGSWSVDGVGGLLSGLLREGLFSSLAVRELIVVGWTDYRAYSSTSLSFLVPYRNVSDQGEWTGES
jgi:hypothetical protein